MIGRKDENGPLGKGVNVNVSFTLSKTDVHGVVYLKNGEWWDGSQVAQTLDRVLSKGQTMPEKNRFPAVIQSAAAFKIRGGCEGGGKGFLGSEEKAFTLQTGHDQDLFIEHGAENIVRRLTPLECERLQGFPDNYTKIPGASDTVRYQAIGNSMTTNVMAYIGKRIDLVSKIF